MKMIDTDFVRRTWQYKPEFSKADTTSLSSMSNTITANINATSYLDDEIKRKLNQIYREREAEMNNLKFNDLAKDLKEFGIELETIRHSSGNAGCEIEGYLYPDKYKIHRAKEICSVPISPKKPLPKKVIFSGPATTILWKDGTKTTVKCSSEDVWDDDVGIAMCYLKKMLGNKGNYNNIFREAMKVAEVQCKKEDLNVTKNINISEINDLMKDAANALDKVLGGKK